MEEHDVLVCPATLMLPFDARLRYPSALGKAAGLPTRSLTKPSLTKPSLTDTSANCTQSGMRFI